MQIKNRLTAKLLKLSIVVVILLVFLIFGFTAKTQDFLRQKENSDIEDIKKNLLILVDRVFINDSYQHQGFNEEEESDDEIIVLDDGITDEAKRFAEVNLSLSKIYHQMI